MHLRLPVVCFTSVALLSGATAHDSTPPLGASPSHAPSVSTGQPQVGTFGLNVEGMDRSVAPGDDFFRYAVGKWLDATEIPQDRSN